MVFILKENGTKQKQKQTVNQSNLVIIWISKLFSSKNICIEEWGAPEQARAPPDTGVKDNTRECWGMHSPACPTLDECQTHFPDLLKCVPHSSRSVGDACRQEMKTLICVLREVFISKMVHSPLWTHLTLLDIEKQLKISHVFSGSF